MPSHDTKILVRVVECRDRKHYEMRFKCPINGRLQRRSTGVEITGKKRDRTAAERVAAKWESELREGRYQPPSMITWDEFRDRHENEVQPGLAEKTGVMFSTVFNAVEEILAPAKLADLTADKLSHFTAELRTGKRAESTIRTYLAHLKSALNWAVDLGLLRAVPKIQKPQRAKGGKVMKGRPITTEEFERMLLQVPAVVLTKKKADAKPAEPAKPADPEKQACDAALVASWRHYLRGLWCSGLRLAESLELYWDRPDKLCIDTSGRRPMMRIAADEEKGNQDRLLPLAPEFAEMLMAVSEAERKGRVFKLVDRQSNPREFQADWVGRVVSAIGEQAKVKVNSKVVDGKEVVKYASAHDLRRSFGERWASRVMPQVLMELMRHESIDTTLKYYVGRNAQTIGDVLWAAHEAASGHKTGHKAPKRPRAK